MPNKFISIQESADLSSKSVQTIRRAIKSKKLKHRRQKTPQGFNYMVSYEALCTLYNIKPIPTVKVEAKKEKTELIKMHEWFVYSEFDDASKAAADFIAEKIEASIKKKGVCHVVLPGGNTPAQCLTYLANKKLPWNQVQWYLGDEPQ